MEISNKTFDEHVLTSTQPVFVEFWASWCPPCHTIKKILKKLESEETGYVIYTLNTDRNLKTASRYDVKGLPCFMVFKEGELVHREVGAKSEKQIREMLIQQL